MSSRPAPPRRACPRPDLQLGRFRDLPKGQNFSFTISKVRTGCYCESPATHSETHCVETRHSSGRPNSSLSTSQLGPSFTGVRRSPSISWGISGSPAVPDRHLMEPAFVHRSQKRHVQVAPVHIGRLLEKHSQVVADYQQSVGLRPTRPCNCNFVGQGCLRKHVTALATGNSDGLARQPVQQSRRNVGMTCCGFSLCGPVFRGRPSRTACEAGFGTYDSRGLGSESSPSDSP